MENKTSEIVFILDKSGSMSGLEEDTIGGYNNMLKKQRDEEGRAIVTTVLFDHEYHLIHDRTNIKEIKPLTEEEYFVGGYTALLDAIGKTINKIINAKKHTKVEYEPDNTIFVIITDGMENASREYGYGKISQLIKSQKEKYNWEFIFLGANIDAIVTAEKFGINADRATNYHADSEGTELSYEVLNNVIKSIRVEEKIDKNWKIDIEKDYERRKKR